MFLYVTLPKKKKKYKRQKVEKAITEGWVRYYEGFKLGSVRLNCEPHSSVYFHRWWSTGMMSFQRFCRLSGSCGPLEFEATFPLPRSSRAAKLNLRLWIYVCECVCVCVSWSKPFVRENLNIKPCT